MLEMFNPKSLKHDATEDTTFLFNLEIINSFTKQIELMKLIKEGNSSADLDRRVRLRGILNRGECILCDDFLEEIQRIFECARQRINDQIIFVDYSFFNYNLIKKKSNEVKELNDKIIKLIREKDESFKIKNLFNLKRYVNFLDEYKNINADLFEKNRLFVN
jgi:hypothetical protein